MVLNAAFFNIQRYKVRIKGKVDQGKELRPPLYLSVLANEKGAFGSSSSRVSKFTFL